MVSTVSEGHGDGRVEDWVERRVQLAGDVLVEVDVGLTRVTFHGMDLHVHLVVLRIVSSSEPLGVAVLGAFSAEELHRDAFDLVGQVSEDWGLDTSVLINPSDLVEVASKDNGELGLAGVRIQSLVSSNWTLVAKEALHLLDLDSLGDGTGGQISLDDVRDVAGGIVHNTLQDIVDDDVSIGDRGRDDVGGGVDVGDHLVGLVGDVQREDRAVSEDGEVVAIGVIHDSGKGQSAWIAWGSIWVADDDVVVDSLGGGDVVGDIHDEESVHTSGRIIFHSNGIFTGLLVVSSPQVGTTLSSRTQRQELNELVLVLHTWQAQDVVTRNIQSPLWTQVS